MHSAYKVLAAMRGTASKLEKQAILEHARDDGDLMAFLQAVYEPKINFYMTAKSYMNAGTNLPMKRVFDRKLLTQLIHELGGRHITGNEAKNWVADLHAGFANDWEREMLLMLIDRDVRAGFGANTINKVWPDLITDVPYMRCSLPKHVKLDQFAWSTGVYSQTKADGMYCAADHGADGVVAAESRNGTPFPMDILHLIEAEIRSNIPQGQQIHGEMLLQDSKGRILPRQESNGAFNRILQGGELPAGTVVIFKVWDMIPIAEARPKSKYKVPYNVRWELLQSFLSTRKYVLPIDTKIVHSFDEALADYRVALQAGEEGTIIKDPRMIWEDTTSKWQVKCKLEVPVDLVVVGFNEGAGKNAATFGSLQCESADGKLKCGASGFTDAMRQEIWDDRDRMLGRIVTVKSNCILPPTNKDYWSLFLPIFLELRGDKKKADTLEQVKDQFDNAIAA